MKIFAYPLAAILLSLFPYHSFACQPIAGFLYEVTEEDRIRQSELVVVGRVIGMRKSQDRYTFHLTIIVEHWIKGNSNRILEVMDTTGTDCDSLSDINHIVMQPNPLFSKWKIYLHPYQGKLYVGDAKEM